MIISRAPVRISLGGGGTDIASYYSRFGGFLIAGAINKYIYLCVNKRFDDSIRLSYSKTEIVTDADAIQHRIFREAFKLLGIRRGIEAVSIADVPANCGLGSSSVFTVSLLNALHHYKREYVGLDQLAEEACKIEIELLGEPIGKQDQYAAAFGGLTCLTFDTAGHVRVEPLRIQPEVINQLESNLLLFYTRIERRASEILSEQTRSVEKNEPQSVEAMHRIKELGLRTRDAFEKGDLDSFGRILNEHWQAKKLLTARITDPFIDECYSEALQNGALGGKIIGAGGGGFFLFYCPTDHARLMESMKRKGLPWMPFRFEHEGAKIVANLNY